jgi:hypothetical protein
MKAARVRLPSSDENVAPVTILDGLGRVIRIVPAEQFRRDHGVPGRPTTGSWRRKRERVKTSEIAPGAAERAIAS